MEFIDEAILKTLLYSDIFDFPLTKDELWHFLISDKKIEKTDFDEALRKLIQPENLIFQREENKIGVIYKQGFYCLSGRQQIIKDRKSKLTEAYKKNHIAQRAAYYLSLIPTIEFIGISGSLALKNASINDDIDFFVIVKKNTLFMTRFWILCTLEWLKLRRKRNERSAIDKVCVNLLLDETKLTWSTGKRDLYVAHEIVQVIPLFERNNMYKKFMINNKWIEKFFPNIKVNEVSFLQRKWKTNFYSLKIINLILTILRFENIIRKVQYIYMKKYQTSEVVTNSFLAFHPIDYRAKIMNDLRTKYRKIGLLTNI